VLERHSAWLFVNTQVKVYSREIHSLSWEFKIHGHKAFQITHIHMSLLPTVTVVITLHNSTPQTLCGAVELASALTAGAILADAAVMPMSPK